MEGGDKASWQSLPIPTLPPPHKLSYSLQETDGYVQENVIKKQQQSPR